MNKREILDAVLTAEPGDLCNGCDASEAHWHPSPRGTHLTHDGRTAVACRFPCRGACDHADCAEIRPRLRAAR